MLARERQRASCSWRSKLIYSVEGLHVYIRSTLQRPGDTWRGGTNPEPFKLTPILHLSYWYKVQHLLAAG